jgi:uncharacterized protein (TIGR00255 family)
MIRGMTGFGRSSREHAGLRASVEIRTVNHRYCEVHLRLPRQLAGQESLLRRRVSTCVGRGRADVFIRLERDEGDLCQVQVNRSLVEGLMAGAESLKGAFGVHGEADLQTLLHFPEVITIRPQDEELAGAEIRLVEKALEEALAGADEMRREEGRVIAADLGPRLDRVEEQRREIAARAAKIPEGIRQRLDKRLRDLLPSDVPLDSGRLEQEVAVLAERADITEEIVRLKGYIEQAGRVLKNDGTGNGRRLDFLLQEMYREINTVGSKASDAEIGSAVIEIKQELERIREQVQNIA